MLKELYGHTDVQAWLNKQKIFWEFSTPASSHHQGLVERQIRSFREVTEGILGPGFHKRTPTDFEMMTVIREAEYVMNCKPLGRYMGDEDAITPIGPIDLIIGF